MKDIVLFLAILMSITAYKAQGLVLNDKGMDLVPKTANAGSKGFDDEIENTYSLSLRPYCPTPQDQGEDANCVGWSVGYAAQTIRKAYLEQIEDRDSIDKFAFSPFFIYNNIKLKDCGMGAEIPEALQFLIRTGNVSVNSFEDGRNNCNAVPKNNNYEAALNNRIRGFEKLFTPKDSKQKKIKVVKEALIDGYPVVIAMNILESFANMDRGSDTWYSKTGSQVPAGGHALVVVGYDELKNAFEVMNSWGDGWADEGFAFIKYDDFHEYVRYGFAFSENDFDPFSLMVNFDRSIMITKDGKHLSEKELFRWDDNKYTLATKDYRPNSTYQINFFHSRPGYKLYCFNASGESNYSELFRIDGSENELTTDMRSFGFSLPPLNFTNPDSERFLFVVANQDLSKEQLMQVTETSELDTVREIFGSTEIEEEKILSYSRVAMTSRLEENVMLIPVEFVKE